MEIPEWKEEGQSLGCDVIVHSISRNDLALHEISKEQSEFQKAAFQFFTFTKQPIECVERVEVIEYGPRSEVRTNYESCREDFAARDLPTVEILVFHGTPTIGNVHKIVISGFKVGGVDKGVKVAHGSAYGPGVYTAISPHTPQQYAKGTNAIILAKGLRGKVATQNGFALNANSVSPNPDWVIFKKGCQVLPLYVVYFNYGQRSYPKQAMPVIAPYLQSKPMRPRGLVPVASQAAERKKKAAEEAAKAAEAAAKKEEAEDAAREEEELRAAIAASFASISKPLHPPALTQEELDAQERAIQQATAASVMEYERSIGEEERMIELAIAQSLGQSTTGLIAHPSLCRRSGDKGSDYMHSEEEGVVIDLYGSSVGGDSQSEADLQRAVEASLKESACDSRPGKAEHEEEEWRKQEEEELALAIAISQAILSHDPFICSSAATMATGIVPDSNFEIISVTPMPSISTEQEARAKLSDWTCPNCFNLNWSLCASCNICHGGRPSPVVSSGESLPHNSSSLTSTQASDIMKSSLLAVDSCDTATLLTSIECGSAGVGSGDTMSGPSDGKKGKKVFIFDMTSSSDDGEDDEDEVSDISYCEKKRRAE